MRRIEDDCVGCSPPLDCLGRFCPYRNAEHIYCDLCGEEESNLYEYKGEELCEGCVNSILDAIIDGLEETEGVCCSWCEDDECQLYIYENEKVCRECIFEDMKDKLRPVRW